jgi:hypothetical protein
MPIRGSTLRIAALVFAAVVLVTVLLYWRSKTRAEDAQARRNASYQQALSGFQRDLRLGMHRSEVYSYLRSHSVEYGETNGINALVPIGRDPAPASSICEFFYVSILFEFNELPHQQEPSPLDNLKDISIYKDCQK